MLIGVTCNLQHACCCTMHLPPAPWPAAPLLIMLNTPMLIPGISKITPPSSSKLCSPDGTQEHGSRSFLDEDRHPVSNTSASWASRCAGDPIEVGAATAVLRGASCPVRFTAAKSRIGHAEPAAGLVGILHVSARLPSPPPFTSSPRSPCGCCAVVSWWAVHGRVEQLLACVLGPDIVSDPGIPMQAVATLSGSRSSALPHLRSLNNHVASTISTSTAAGQLAPALPRQDAPAPLPRSEHVMGVSSFAFQVSFFRCSAGQIRPRASCTHNNCRRASITSRLSYACMNMSKISH